MNTNLFSKKEFGFSKKQPICIVRCSLINVWFFIIEDMPAVALLISLKAQDDVNEYLGKTLKSTAPQLVAFNPETDNDDFDGQLFTVVDKFIFLQLSEGKLDFTRGLLILLAVYFAFNLRYDDKQKLMFSFLEEHLLGLKLVCKSLRYNKYCNKIFAIKLSAD